MTVVPVFVVVATAEPFGAYHLSALAEGLAEHHRDHDIVHLIPYDAPTQGRSPFPCVVEASVLEHADRVVVVGGGLSPWTELVARRTVSLGTPLLYTQLAKYSPFFPADLPVRVVTAFTQQDAARFASAWPGAALHVTGNPLLDDMSIRGREPGRVLVLSTADVRERDPGHVLPRFAAELAETRPLAVRPHPREVPGVWEGLPLLADGSFVEQVSAAEMVLAYEGSLVLAAAHRGAKVVLFRPAGSDILSSEDLAALPNTASTLDGLRALCTAPAACDPGVLAGLLGPVGGSALRILDAWCGDLPGSGT